MRAALATIFFACGTASAQDGWQFGPSLEIAHPGSDFKMRVNSYVQGDLLNRRNFTDGDDEEAGPERHRDRLIRRARFGLEGEWGRFRFEVRCGPERRSRAPEGPVRTTSGSPRA